MAGEKKAALIERGYVEILDHATLKPGQRIRHRGDQHARAYVMGTATIIAVMEKLNSPWSQSYNGDRDIEVVVLSERDPGNPVETLWADYHIATLNN